MINFTILMSVVTFLLGIQMSNVYLQRGGTRPNTVLVVQSYIRCHLGRSDFFDISMFSTTYSRDVCNVM